MKKLFTLLLTAMLLLSGAFAVPAVKYEGGAELFVFAPGSEYSETDLFETFKDVLPGDVINLKIPVSNFSGKRVRLWMRAEPVKPEDVAFLSQLTLKVDCDENTIFEATAAETKQLTTYVLLGTFRHNGVAVLDVTLTVPKEMGNEFSGVSATVPWTFKVDELPSDPTPDTGDTFELATWIAVGAAIGVSILVILLVLIKRRKAEA